MNRAWKYIIALVRSFQQGLGTCTSFSQLSYLCSGKLQQPKAKAWCPVQGMVALQQSPSCCVVAAMVLSCVLCTFGCAFCCSGCRRAGSMCSWHPVLWHHIRPRPSSAPGGRLLHAYQRLPSAACTRRATLRSSHQQPHWHRAAAARTCSVQGRDARAAICTHGIADCRWQGMLEAHDCNGSTS